MKPLALIRTTTLIIVATLAACDKPEPQAPAKTPHRTDFTPEEFGIGRQHTRDAACNREIDQLLDQIRICVNKNPEAECKQLQSNNNDRIAKLKNSLRCKKRKTRVRS